MSFKLISIPIVKTDYAIGNKVVSIIQEESPIYTSSLLIQNCIMCRLDWNDSNFGGVKFGKHKKISKKISNIKFYAKHPLGDIFTNIEVNESSFYHDLITDLIRIISMDL